MFDKTMDAYGMPDKALKLEGDVTDVAETQFWFGLISDIVNGITHLVNNNRRPKPSRGDRRRHGMAAIMVREVCAQLQRTWTFISTHCS